jgi:hypothetical protein
LCPRRRSRRHRTGAWCHRRRGCVIPLAHGAVVAAAGGTALVPGAVVVAAGSPAHVPSDIADVACGSAVVPGANVVAAGGGALAIDGHG